MTEIRVKVKRGALYELRRDSAVIAFLEGKGEMVVDSANETLPEKVGYRMSSSQGRKNPQGRWAVRVFTSSNHAKHSNAVHNTLIRALLNSR